MSEGTTNLHKSPAGWARFQERTKQGENARRATMDHSTDRSKKIVEARDAAPKPYRRSKKIVASSDAASDQAFQPHLRNRRRVVIDPR